MSLKEIAICVVDAEGDAVLRMAVPCEPSAVADAFTDHGLQPDRVVHESGQISIWLQRGLMRRGLPAVCIDARMAHRVLSARSNKSDRADAEGLAQLARTGWFTSVHIRSVSADRFRTLIGARDRLVRLRVDLEGRVSRRGDATLRQLLFEAPSTLISRVKRLSPLKFWAVRLAARKGFKKAAVATARKLAVLMLAMWKNGTEFARHNEVAL